MLVEKRPAVRNRLLGLLRDTLHAPEPSKYGADFTQIRVCCMNRVDPALPLRPPLLPDRIGLRATEFPHPIEQLTGKRRLSFLRRVSLRPHVTAKGPFVAREGVLRMGLRVVT